jgi:hypothetical protein
MYAEYFPLLALATYQKAMTAAEAAVRSAGHRAPERELGEA